MIEGKLGRRRGEFGERERDGWVRDNGGEEEDDDDEILDRLVSSLGLEILGRPLWGAPSNSRSEKRASESGLGLGNGPPSRCGQPVMSRKWPVTELGGGLKSNVEEGSLNSHTCAAQPAQVRREVSLVAITVGKDMD